MSVYLVTGGTGFLGGYLLERLSRRGEKIYALVRPGSKSKVEPYPNVEWIEGDLENPELCARLEDREKLASVTQIIHAAALYDLQASRDTLYWTNIVGTHHVVHFASGLTQLEAFHYVSTMAVAGDYRGTFTENMFAEGQSFPDAYAATKFAAEACVREWTTTVPRFIYRLGILVGESNTGKIPKIDGPYYLIRALHANDALRAVLKRIRAVPLPFSERARLYLVPVDSAADAIATIVSDCATRPGKAIRTYHLMGEPGGVAVRTVLKRTLAAAGVDAKVLAVRSTLPVRWVAEQLRVPKETLFYMESGCQFEMTRLAVDHPDFHFPRFEEYAPAMYRYASEVLFHGGAA